MQYAHSSPRPQSWDSCSFPFLTEIPSAKLFIENKMIRTKEQIIYYSDK